MTGVELLLQLLNLEFQVIILLLQRIDHSEFAPYETFNEGGLDVVTQMDGLEEMGEESVEVGFVETVDGVFVSNVG